MSSNVKVAVAQLNCTVGDFEGNSRKIIEAASRAAAAGTDLLLTPELSLSGYPPEDLLLRRAFYAASDDALQTLDRTVVAVSRSDGRRWPSTRA